MAKFTNLTLTNGGRSYLAGAQNGDTITISKIAVGDGVLGSVPLEDLTALINQKQVTIINSINVTGNKTKVTAVLSNETTTEDFYIREVGIFAKNSLGTEILYAIANNGDSAEILPAFGGTTVVNKIWDFVLLTNSASSITATIDEDSVYVPWGEYDSHVDQKVYDAGGVHGFNTATPGSGNNGQFLKWDNTQSKHIYSDIPTASPSVLGGVKVGAGLSVTNGVLSGTQVAVLSGTIAHGGTIPLPSGYTQAQCKWFVSPHDTNPSGVTFDPNDGNFRERIYCHADGNRVVTMFTSNINEDWGNVTITGIANYWIIGIK